MSESPDIWCIRGGREGQANHLFLDAGYVAIGWHELGDLSKITEDWEVLKSHVTSGIPDIATGAVGTTAGMLWRFVNDLKPGDIVVYPSKADLLIHIGKIRPANDGGAYSYDPSKSKEFPNLRRVTWLKHVPRTAFSQGALYEINSALTLFKIKSHANEVLRLLGAESVPVPQSTDEVLEGDAAAPDADEIEQITRDFVIKQLASELKGHPFSDFVAHLFSTLGYRCKVSPPGADGGIDIIAYKDELGVQPPILKVQVKSTEGSVGDPVVSQLSGVLAPGEFGVLVTLGSFTAQAKNAGRMRANVRLLDGYEVVELVLAQYDKLDARYKAILPLRRVFVPDAESEL